jgi:hypothetical protein
LLTLGSFAIGYILGSRNSAPGVYNITGQSTLKDHIKQNSNITIDDKKFVVDINTSNLEKKYDNLGEVVESKENISSSINKLKNLKR